MAGGLGEEVVGYREADTYVVLVVVVQGTDMGSGIKEWCVNSLYAIHDWRGGGMVQCAADGRSVV